MLDEMSKEELAAKISEVLKEFEMAPYGDLGLTADRAGLVVAQALKKNQD